ncbi:hypothetical protein F4778DRAFT_410940 [Xylariomycetidae sp. FL2044]|nr:hypothetical protein F4778DRAFT_410940 [Xylariomycetidae sp. FL2044]
MSSAANTFLRSASRASIRRTATPSTNPARTLRRTYADGHKAPLSQGGNNRGLIIGFVGIAVPTIAYLSTRRAAGVDIDPAKMPSAPPALDPAAKKREKKETEPGTPKYKHPEHEDPELQASFGRVHKQKRVDGPPDDRNHQSLQDRQRQH